MGPGRSGSLGVSGRAGVPDPCLPQGQGDDAHAEGAHRLCLGGGRDPGPGPSGVVGVSEDESTADDVGRSTPRRGGCRTCQKQGKTRKFRGLEVSQVKQRVSSSVTKVYRRYWGVRGTRTGPPRLQSGVTGHGLPGVPETGVPETQTPGTKQGTLESTGGTGVQRT